MERLKQTIELVLFREQEFFDHLLSCRSFRKVGIEEWYGPAWWALYMLPFLLCYVVYGFFVGLHVAIRHASYLAVRLPLVALSTGLFGFLPLLFLTRRYSPPRLSLGERAGQLAALLAGQMAISGVSLCAFVPLLWLMLLRDPPLPIFELSNVVLMGAAGLLGLLFLARGYRYVYRGDLSSWSIGFGLLLYVIMAFEWTAVWGPYFIMDEAFAQAMLPQVLLKLICPRFDADNIAQALPSLLREVVRLVGDWLS